MELKDELLNLKTTLANVKHINFGTFQGFTFSTYSIRDYGIELSGWMQRPNSYGSRWSQVRFTWDELETEKGEDFKNWITSKLDAICPNMDVTKDKNLIKFYDRDKGEALHCDMRDKRFIKVYKNGREKVVYHPHSFFKGKLGHLLLPKIPADLSFYKLMKRVIHKETRCRNFGTFLIRMFDKAHLETYIALDKPYTYDISVGYDWFDKDVRKVLDAHKVAYDTSVQQFFVTNYDRAKSFFTMLKGEERFADLFRLCREQARHINILIDQYGYEPKALYKYAKERDFSATGHKLVNAPGHLYQYNFNLFQELADYIQMAATVEYYKPPIEGEEVVLEEAVEEDEQGHIVLKTFEKYPKDLHLAHSKVTVLNSLIENRYNEQEFASRYSEKLEYRRKEFSIINPTNTAEVKMEGAYLGHCVGTYVERIIRGETLVVFLRKTEEIDVPYYTIEVKNNRISQIQGRAGKRPEYEETEFLKRYSKATGIVYYG